MATPVEPKDVFQCALPTGGSLVVVFVPSKDREGKSITQEFWIDEISTVFGRQFRGGTAFPRGRGVWRDDSQSGKLLYEEPVIAFSYTAEELITTAALHDLYLTLSRMGREAKQGEVGVVIDGKYYGITTYAEG